MKTKILVMAVIEKDGGILMRKKPEGSKPYAETWYLFGVDLQEGNDPEESLLQYLKETVGIEAKIEKTLGWASEEKEDHDGEVKRFIYLDTLCKYLSGEPRLPQGTEKIEWVSRENLTSYDLVPPTVELFKRIGYLEK